MVSSCRRGRHGCSCRWTFRGHCCTCKVFRDSCPVHLARICRSIFGFCHVLSPAWHLHHHSLISVLSISGVHQCRGPARPCSERHRHDCPYFWPTRCKLFPPDLIEAWHPNKRVEIASGVTLSVTFRGVMRLKVKASAQDLHQKVPHHGLGWRAVR